VRYHDHLVLVDSLLGLNERIHVGELCEQNANFMIINAN
jgi:hypothetical protein